MNQRQLGLSGAENHQPWAIVLAAGEGRRLAPVTRLLYGRDVPKQFAALDGDRTLLQRTMDRLDAIVPPERTVVVVAEEWRITAEEQLFEYDGVQVIAQPGNAGTGPGVLLPLSLIKAQCPDATVVITPSDHHIAVVGALIAALRKALEVARHAPAGLALLGADADAPVTDLGWIVPRNPAASADAELDLVDCFIEKPPIEVADRLFRDGGLWNTLIVVGQVAAFWRQGQQHLSHHTALFDEYVQALERAGGRPDVAADQLLARLYRSMSSADFSRTILQNAAGLGVVRLKESGWCDCGTPERLLACLDKNEGARRHMVESVVQSVQAQVQPGTHPRPIPVGN